MRQAGIFITFEGIDGCGKTTQLGLLADGLRQAGYPVVQTVEPGGTSVGLQIRQILLNPQNSLLQPRAELLLYFVSRAQNVEQIIRPALAENQIVLCDRFTDSTVAYQGSGRGLDYQAILELDRYACQGLAPDFTFLIDIDLDTSRQRCHARNRANGSGETRIDDESAAFHSRVREGYHALAHQYPERIRVIDGSQPVGVVAHSVWAQIELALAHVR